ncbi:cell surface polysaccharide export ABC-2 transporter permease [Ketogulonicigenium robustum]|uniref:Transport permease protein n=1 Tax=Ketogulonicigenium robustum TaxID=92947 RepID=A0A1W6P1X0_9RHOB|nr:ABC transporter permease [Ketogulonicigenium robustum]ARO15476.1 cell surface polysaccharide export ABC-2 transporter permease [Ketogulonicigenium robustum]
MSHTLPPPSPLLQSARVILALTLREMSASYGRSALGYAWAFIAPLGIVGLLALGFSLVVHAPPLGRDFMLFYATGFLPFEMFLQITHRIKDSLRFSRPLLSYPRVVWIDIVIARLILQLVTQSAVFTVVVAALLLTRDTGATLQFGAISTALAMAALLGLGAGLLNCALIAHLPAWDRIWGILARPLFFGSGVFFLLESLPPAAQSVLWLNPLVHVTGLMRHGFYPSYAATFVSLAYGFGLALAAIAMGLVLLRHGYSKAVSR